MYVGILIDSLFIERVNFEFFRLSALIQFFCEKLREGDLLKKSKNFAETYLSKTRPFFCYNTISRSAMGRIS